MNKEISIKEVKKHKSRKSTWVILHNEVYDVTSFLSEHPGGEDSLLDVAGKDGTLAFEDVGHSADARQMMKKYKIGQLPIAEHSKPVAPCCTVKSKKPKRSSCPDCTEDSCPSGKLPKSSKNDKSWRTYDGGPSSSRPGSPKSSFKEIKEPRASGRIKSIIVPRERRPPRPRGQPCGGSNLKWALLALAAAIVIAIVIKKNMG
ncbi:cytochrome b5-like isoform X2 [Plodia interpunctella]|uniref:cytochrome b5-like isoform X2 n=1 Tax=Plodia interpunctella TaxID=58824 RepID=UPI00236861F2|nr:cytochrome b5-like isoform X2 [Plodia interpunctella]